MKAAIYLKNNVVCKTNNIQKKLKRESDLIEILEEWEYNNNVQKLDEKYNYWNRILNRNSKEEEIAESKLYKFENPKTGHSVISIYPDLEQCKSYIKDWMDYVKLD